MNSRAREPNPVVVTLPLLPILNSVEAAKTVANKKQSLSPRSRQADGLGSSITRILKTMQRDIHAKDPQAINSAVNAVIAVTRADVQALAQAGRIVVRRSPRNDPPRCLCPVP
jgi:hypothetical protein